MSTNTALAILNTAVPAHLQDASQFMALNDDALGGIKVGGFPRIGIKGSKFHLHDPEADPPVRLITDPTPGREGLPLMALDAVIVAANQGISKKFYDGKYDPDDEDKSPDCSSDGGLVPDAHIEKPVHTACATCPKNQWGSKINETNGKEGKACSDSKRLVILPVQDLTFKALALDVTASALKDYGAYIRTLSARNVSVVAVATRITFDPQAAYPKLQFQVLRYLTAEEYATVKSRIDADDVKAIVAPKRVVPLNRLPPAQPAPAAVSPLRMPDPTTHSVESAVAAGARSLLETNLHPVTPLDQIAAQAALVVTSPQPFGGAAEPAKRGRKPKTETPGVDAVTQAAAAALTGGVSLGATVGVDINTIPEPFKSTIIALGGLASAAGKAVYDAMPKATAAPAPQVISPSPPVTAGFASPPSGSQVVMGGDLSSQLAALLKK